MKAIRRLVARQELITDGQLFDVAVLWVVVAGLALQLVILPYVIPSSHWGHGLIANVDGPGFHMMAVETAQRMRLQGVLTDFGRWRDGTYNYPVAISSLFYLIYPELW